MVVLIFIRIVKFFFSSKYNIYNKPVYEYKGNMWKPEAGAFFFYCNLTCLKGWIKEKRKGDQKGRKYYFSEDQTIVIVNKDRTLVRYRNDSIYLSTVFPVKILPYPDSKLNNYSITSLQHSTVLPLCSTMHDLKQNA